MDRDGNPITWLGNVFQKIESLIDEVDVMVSEFCSEHFPPSLDCTKGRVPDLSLEQNEITELAAHESLEECADKNSEKGLSNVIYMPHESDDAEGVHIDKSLELNTKITELAAHESTEQCVDEDSEKGLSNVISVPHESDDAEGVNIDKYLELNTETAKGNPVGEKYSSEIPELTAHAGTDSSVVLSWGGLFQSNEEENLDGGIQLLIPTAFDWCNLSTEEGKSCNIVNATANITTALSLASSLLSVDSFECEAPKSGLTSTTEECNSSIEEGKSCNIVNDTTDVTIALSPTSSFLLVDSFECQAPESGLTSPTDVLSAVSKNYAATEEYGDAIEPSMKTSQPYDGLNLEDSCILVDSSEFFPISPKVITHQSNKAVRPKLKLARKKNQKSSCYEHLDGDGNQNGIRSSAPSTLVVNSGSSDNECCEFEWEII